jgi:hypothetical protein
VSRRPGTPRSARPPARVSQAAVILPVVDIEQHPFVNFSHSVGAARSLLGHAQERRSWIEGIVLYASVIDALLWNPPGARDG